MSWLEVSGAPVDVGPPFPWSASPATAGPIDVWPSPSIGGVQAQERACARRLARGLRLGRYGRLRLGICAFGRPGAKLAHGGAPAHVRVGLGAVGPLDMTPGPPHVALSCWSIGPPQAPMARTYSSLHPPCGPPHPPTHSMCASAAHLGGRADKLGTQLAQIQQKVYKCVALSPQIHARAVVGCFPFSYRNV